jgi:cysteine synthase A
MTGAIKKAEELASKIPHSFIPGQFDNNDNKLAHKRSTGPEIYEDTDGDVDVFVAGIGTGGTLSGVAEYLKSKKPQVHTVGIEPAESPLITRGEAHPHALQGIGANFIPSVLDLDVIDEMLTVSKDEAYSTVQMLGATEGIAVGISAGAALFGAIETAKKEEYEGKTVVVLLPDGMDRYLSTDLY